MAKAQKELLVVDGYNVLFKSERYMSLTKHSPEDDPFARGRELLLADVATYAQGRFDATIVYDGAGNISPERPSLKQAGVRIIFSDTGESADSVIERLVVEARLAEREVSVVTSDNTIRATVGGVPVKRISSDVLVHDVDVMVDEVQREVEERTHTKMTLEDRLDPKTRAKLDMLLGRSSNKS